MQISFTHTILDILVIKIIKDGDKFQATYPKSYNINTQ